MNHIAIKWTVFLALILCLTSAVTATELYIPEIKAKPGDIVGIPVKIDLVDNLAGIKLVLKYDSDVLAFKNAKKTKETSPLMHIVNDKKPGTLVVVMAGAKGINGKDFSIVVLDFEVKKDVKDKKTAKIEITEVQLMNDQLKDIKCDIKVSPLVILSEGSDMKKAVQETVPAQDAEKAVDIKAAAGNPEKTEVSPEQKSEDAAVQPVAKDTGKSEKTEVSPENKAEDAAVQPVAKDTGKSAGDVKKDSEKPSEPLPKSPEPSATPSK
jgi:hypothetical protein